MSEEQKQSLQAEVARVSASLETWSNILNKARAQANEAGEQIKLNQGYLQGLQRALELLGEPTAPAVGSGGN